MAIPEFRTDFTGPERMAYYEATMRRYAELVAEKDVAGICKLFADDAVFEDPIGKADRYFVGTGEIAAFLGQSLIKGSIRIRGIRQTHGRVLGLDLLAMRTGEVEIDAFSVVEFDDAGKIARYSVLWGPDNMRTLG